MKFAILHLSDIHIKTKSDFILGRADSIAAAIYPLLPEVAAVVVVITGDIAYGGQAEEYELASEFLKEILSKIKCQFSGTVKVVMVPGNHDGRFKASSNARNASIDYVLSKGEVAVDESMIAVCTELQDQYFAFEDKFLPSTEKTGDNLWKEVRLEIEGKTVCFSCINASWMSTVPETPGKLLFPIGRYEAVLNEPCDIRVAVMHHPLNWYGQSSYHAFRDACRTHFQIIFSGHEHTSSVYSIDDAKLGRSITIEAGALAPHHQSEGSSFLIASIDTELQKIANVTFLWTETMYAPENGLPLWDNYVDLPKKRTDGFEPSKRIRAQIEDIGATFTHPNVERISMSHLFVYPHLIDLDQEITTPQPIGAEILSSQIDGLGKVLIRGDEQYGKTTLLNRLFARHFEAGYIPLLISGKDLHGSTPEQFMRRILRAVGDQYGESSQVRYSQLGRERKILLVDDLDTPGVHADSLSRTLEFIDKHFDLVVIAVGDTFDMTELASVRASAVTKTFRHFRITGFGFELRSEIIKRWIRLGNDDGKTEFESRVHDAQTLIDSVIGKGLVPTSALSVLILLQTIETGQRSALANAGLAQYYEYMVRRALIDAKVKADELDEVINYLAGLAWMASQIPSQPMELAQLDEYTSDFSARYQKTELTARLDLLLRARILKKVGGSYLFRYPYIRYFFKAQYIATQIDDNPGLIEYVRRCCNHLYLSENANTILFVTHHLSSKWIIREIADVLGKLLTHVGPLDIIGDTVVFNRWVTETARIAVDVTDIESNNKRQLAKADRAVAQPEKEESCELSSINDLDFVGQVNLLFKTSEILGQILKNKYGSLDKTIKAELISELLKGPLRGVRIFIQTIIDEPDAIIKFIADRLKEKSPGTSREAADKHAQRFIFDSVGQIADSFITRQGEILGSPKLQDDISGVVGSNITYKLVKIASQLSYPNNIPHADIEFLSKELKNNVFGFRLLQGLAARHIYMFSVPFDERQRLAQAMQIDINTNKAIDLNSSGAKKISPGTKKYEPRTGRSLIMRMQSAYLARLKHDKDSDIAE